MRIFDNLTTGRQATLRALQDLPGKIEFISGDLRARDEISKALEGIDILFHQAALASVPRSIAEPTLTLETNVNGTHNVLLAARDAGVQRVIYASSSSVYGESSTLPKHEAMPPAPLSPYAVHKLTGELLCGLFTRIYGVETVALRYFNVFGPRQDPTSEYAAVIPRFLTALLRKQRPIVFGDGEQTRDFTYVENVVQANLLAATVPAASGHVLNIGCGQQISLNTVLRTAQTLLDTSIEPEFRPARPGDIRDSLADIHQAQQILGYEPEVSFQEGLARTLTALRAQLT